MTTGHPGRRRPTRHTLAAAVALTVAALAEHVWAAGRTHQVAMKDVAFAPAQTTVHVGDTVVWEFRSNVEPHTVSINAVENTQEFIPTGTPGGMVLVFNPYITFPANGTVVTGQNYYNSGLLQPHSVLALRFVRTGVYHYDCQIHPGMDGLITVVPAGVKAGPTQF